MKSIFKSMPFVLFFGVVAAVVYAQSPPPAAESGSRNAVEFIKGLDKNEDGVLSMEEVADTPLKADFPDIDTDKDGKLTASELEAFTPKNTGG